MFYRLVEQVLLEAVKIEPLSLDLPSAPSVRRAKRGKGHGFKQNARAAAKRQARRRQRR